MKKWVKGVKYVMMEGDQSLSGEHTMQYTDVLLQNCIPETDVILLTNVTPINLIFLKKRDAREKMTQKLLFIKGEPIQRSPRFSHYWRERVKIL